MELFRFNNKIEVITEDEEKTAGLIQDIADNKIYFSVSADDKSFKILRKGQRLKGIVYHDNKLISFDAIVTDRIPGDIPTYELSSLTNFENIQRRDDVRVSCSLPIKYTGNKNAINTEIDDSKIKETIGKVKDYLNHGIMLDISAGGVRFTCKDKYEYGDALLFLIELDDKTILTKGIIRHKESNLSEKGTRYTYGVQFINISERKREQIISYIFVLMRRDMQR
ncbi:flagellar brake protein [Wansuia hejianensis]|uniref:PilZ domain-containing protein n=1 Tax=Wansuia hejianensis TaxID=2763667 RepID=A0A926EUW1_9FIRM|nr:PilZ domain-containing protein [Wansuia hejianensis]MBC8590283.1 PilZ domain-containing protein [Wansuia hejianensis]